jgi:hypothetical protein
MERVASGQHGDVEIAGGDRYGTRERRFRAWQCGLFDILPVHPSCPFKHELLHAASQELDI